MRNPLVHLRARRKQIYRTVFLAETPEGKRFDIILLILILASVLVVMLETVHPIEAKYHFWFFVLEWIFTIAFTIEYALRLYCAPSARKYAFSFYGIIDFLAILPSYLSIFFAGTQSLMIIRALRLLRIFRILKMGSFMRQGSLILLAMRNARDKITIFLYFIVIAVTIIGSLMYLIEGDANEAFDTIPRSIYWAIVTITTVGYGDITPATSVGQFLSAIVMILGYAVIAVPTGIVSAEFIGTKKDKDRIPLSTDVCKACGEVDHEVTSVYCKKCGATLKSTENA